MANKNKEKTYWPHMILGFLAIGITLGYWTVKSAISIPVQESNNYMLKYQQADMSINEILESEVLFDQKYMIELVDTQTVVIELENAKRAKKEKVVELTAGKNTFFYSIREKSGTVVSDANVTFLLTRPHTRSEDMHVENVTVQNGKYTIEDIAISKAGRYTLLLRAKIGETTGYLELPAYLRP